MRAVAYKQPEPIDRPNALIDIELPVPVATGRDLLVEVRAVSVDPVDAKICNHSGPLRGDYHILAWDAAGIVRAVGTGVISFPTRDKVFYASNIARDATKAELHLVEEQIVGKKPTNLDQSKSAALPPTAITAWEALVDRLNVHKAGPGAANALLVIGGAGGVGSSVRTR